MTRRAWGLAVAMGLAATASRGWLLLRDTTASGYDAWYYVLQTRSLAVGEPLFADGSWLFPVLVRVARLTGDEVLAQELVATVVAGLAVGWGTSVGWRAGGWPAALCLGALWTASTGHLALSSEFLKNGAGLVPLVGVIWALSRPMGPRGWAAAAGLAVVAAGLHKLCGVLALLALAGALVARGGSARGGLLLGGATVASAGLGLLRGVDWLRMGGETGVGRWERLASSSLRPTELLEVAAVHLAPLLVPLAWSRTGPEGRGLVGAAGLLALASVAPGLPFDFESTAWRLVVMGFLPLGLLVAACRPSPTIAWVLALLAGLSLPVHLAAHRRRSPDYAAWAPHLATVRGALPEGARLVAHRGLCGYLWAEGGVRCENFAPVGDAGGWYRVAFGVEREALARHGAVVPLRPGYSLVPEVSWRAFAEAEPDRRMLRDPRNPHQPRPDYVYGPGAPP